MHGLVRRRGLSAHPGADLETVSPVRRWTIRRGFRRCVVWIDGEETPWTALAGCRRARPAAGAKATGAPRVPDTIRDPGEEGCEFPETAMFLASHGCVRHLHGGDPDGCARVQRPGTRGTDRILRQLMCKSPPAARHTGNRRMPPGPVSCLQPGRCGPMTFEASERTEMSACCGPGTLGFSVQAVAI